MEFIKTDNPMSVIGESIFNDGGFYFQLEPIGGT